MRQIVSAAAAALMLWAALVPAQAADVLSPRPPVHPHPYRPVHLPPPRPHWGWVLMPGRGYAPINPIDYSLPNAEYWSRLWEPVPYCCPDPYYYPVYFP